MPSSTSSSSDRVPNLPFGRTWCLALALLVTACAGAECLWRSHGHRASIVDDPQWWAHQRRRVDQAGPEGIVFIGASRSQLGIAPAVVRRRLAGHTVVQLSVAGHDPLEVLRDLADDVRFRGTVVCSAHYSGTVGPGDMSEFYAALERDRSFDHAANLVITKWLQSRLVFVDPHVRTSTVVFRWLSQRTLPEPPWYVTNYDRSQSADFSRADLPGIREYRVRQIFEAPKIWQDEDHRPWQSRIDEVEGLIACIQRRGGHVVLLVFPMTDVTLRLHEQYYPKREYWDRFAAATKALPLHFLDVPSLRRFPCPDTSHLDYRDVPAFTHALVDELLRRGLFEAADTASHH